MSPLLLLILHNVCSIFDISATVKLQMCLYLQLCIQVLDTQDTRSLGRSPECLSSISCGLPCGTGERMTIYAKFDENCTRSASGGKRGTQCAVEIQGTNRGGDGINHGDDGVPGELGGRSATKQNKMSSFYLFCKYWDVVNFPIASFREHKVQYTTVRDDLMLVELRGTSCFERNSLHFVYVCACVSSDESALATLTAIQHIQIPYWRLPPR